MLWSTLFIKIGKQPWSFTYKNHVFALIENNEGILERVYLDINYDAKGNPYLYQNNKCVMSGK